MPIPLTKIKKPTIGMTGVLVIILSSKWFNVVWNGRIC